MRSNKNTERLVRNKHCKSLFNSITNPLNSDHVSTRKFKVSIIVKSYGVLDYQRANQNKANRKRGTFL